MNKRSSTSRSDPYNEAVDLQRGLRGRTSGHAESVFTLVRVIELCQEAVRLRPAHSNALLLLTDALESASKFARSETDEDYIIALTAAAFWEWKLAPTERAFGWRDAFAALGQRLRWKATGRAATETEEAVTAAVMRAVMQRMGERAFAETQDEGLRALNAEFAVNQQRYVGEALDPTTASLLWKTLRPPT